MKNLTEGPIPRHLLTMALPIAFGMLLADAVLRRRPVTLFARLGDAAIAGVSAAGNVMFVVFALTQTSA